MFVVSSDSLSEVCKSSDSNELFSFLSSLAVYHCFSHAELQISCVFHLPLAVCLCMKVSNLCVYEELVKRKVFQQFLADLFDRIKSKCENSERYDFKGL